MKITKEYLEYCYNIMVNFYKNIDNLNFNELNEKRIIELYNMKDSLLEKTSNYKIINYINKMKKFNKNSEKYNISNETEKFILFMFSVDPNFEATKILGEYNKLNDIKLAMILNFGIYDKNLFTIEKLYIKNFFSEKEKEDINNEIEKRAFKQLFFL